MSTLAGSELWGDNVPTDPRITGVLTLLNAAIRPPAGTWRIVGALTLGALTHLLFASGVLAMILAMFFGMSQSFGQLPQPAAWLANGLLILQFPLAHSILLTGPGGRWLARIVPGPYGGTLATTTYALIASVQLLMLFTLWTPSGVIWWQADGFALWIITGVYASTWMLLTKASFDAGVEVQSGALGWMSMLAHIKPRFPDMPTLGLFRIIRQPIYVAFALTLWTVPVWTPDQLVLAISFTGYCLLAPRLKERRFQKRYGERFQRYKAVVPYAVPTLKPTRDNTHA